MKALLNTSDAIKYLAEKRGIFISPITLRRDTRLGKVRHVREENKLKVLELRFTEDGLKEYGRARQRSAMPIQYVEWVQDGKPMNCIGWIANQPDYLGEPHIYIYTSNLPEGGLKWGGAYHWIPVKWVTKRLDVQIKGGRSGK